MGYTAGRILSVMLLLILGLSVSSTHAQSRSKL